VEPEEFEECKKINMYEDFLQAALKYDNLTMEDNKEFMPLFLK